MKPNKVLLFAKAQGYDDVEYIGKWRDFDCFEPLFAGDELMVTGPPLLILQKGDTVRMSTPDEAMAQLDEQA